MAIVRKTTKIILTCSECGKEITGDSCPFVGCKNFGKPFRPNQVINCDKEHRLHSCKLDGE